MKNIWSFILCLEAGETELITMKYMRCTVRDSRILGQMSWSSTHTKIWTRQQLHHCTQRLNHGDISILCFKTLLAVIKDVNLNCEESRLNLRFPVRAKMAENTSFRFFQVIDEFNKNSEEILATFYQPETSYSLYIGVTDRHFLNVNVLSFFLSLFIFQHSYEVFHINTCTNTLWVYALVLFTKLKMVNKTWNWPWTYKINISCYLCHWKKYVCS